MVIEEGKEQSFGDQLLLGGWKRKGRKNRNSPRTKVLMAASQAHRFSRKRSTIRETEEKEASF